MDNLEERVVQLEKQLATLKGSYLDNLRFNSWRITELEIKNHGLEARLKDLDTLEKLVFANHFETNMEARDAILQIERTVPLGVHDPEFLNLPTIKYWNRNS